MSRFQATAEAVVERGFDLEAAARSYYVDLLAYLRSRTRNPEIARDLAQETFLQAYRSRRRFDPERGELRDWLFGIARHVSASAGRQDASFPALQALIEQEWARPSGTADDARLSALSRCLENLAARTRDILRLLYEESIGTAEIAARLGLGLSAVKVAAHRGRQALALCIRRQTGGRP